MSTNSYIHLITDEGDKLSMLIPLSDVKKVSVNEEHGIVSCIVITKDMVYTVTTAEELETMQTFFAKMMVSLERNTVHTMPRNGQTMNLQTRKKYWSQYGGA